MMILQLTRESGHPVFRATSAFERGKLDIKAYGKMSARFDDNEGNIEMLLRTVTSVNQLSIYRILADGCKNGDKNSSEESAPSSDGSESSGTLYAKENVRCDTIRAGVSVMPENARCSLVGDRTNSDTDTSTTSTASTTKSAIRRRRKLRLFCRSQNWMAVLQGATGKPAGSIFIFIFNFAVANELLMATCIIREMVVISVSSDCTVSDSGFFSRHS